MQPPYNDRWERTKRYLFRNFLVNPGFQLSPIPEEERSSPDSDVLPDLIVEPAPNKHDHAPSFYEGLERRMTRYYRQLFLGETRSYDEDSSEFEVNRSMASTFMIDTDTRQENIENKNVPSDESDSDLDFAIIKKKQLHKSTDNSSVRENTNGNKLIDTCGTYNESYQLSIDDSCRVEDKDEENHLFIESHLKSYEAETDLDADIESDGDEQNNDNPLNLGNEDRSRPLGELGVSQTKSVSEDSIEHCHRISTTTVEIHEPRVRTGNMTDIGSPVLIPRLLQFGKYVFGDVTRCSDQSINVLNTSKEINTHQSSSTNKHYVTIEEPEAHVQRLLRDSELTIISLDTDKMVSTDNVGKLVESGKRPERSVECSHEITTEDRIQVSELECEKGPVEEEEVQQEKSAEITDVQNTSIDWNKDGIDDDEDCFDNAVRKGEFSSKARHFMAQISDEESFENLEPIAHSSGRSFNDDSVEVMREAQESRVDESWHGEADDASPALGFEAKISLDTLEKMSSNSDEINASHEEIENEVVNEEMDKEMTGEDIESEISGEEIENEMTGEEIENKMAGEEIESEVSDEEIENEMTGEEIENEMAGEEVENEMTGEKIEYEMTREEVENEMIGDEIENEMTGDKVEYETTDKVIENEVTGEEIENEMTGEENDNEMTDEDKENEMTEEETENKDIENAVTNPEIEKEMAAVEEEFNTPNQHDNARIIDDFWSVSPVEVNFEDTLTEKTSSSSKKRKSVSEDDVSVCKRKKKDIAIQTRSDGPKKWEDIRTQFLVGSPLIFRLCHCEDHICS